MEDLGETVRYVNRLNRLEISVIEVSETTELVVGSKTYPNYVSDIMVTVSPDVP